MSVWKCGCGCDCFLKCFSLRKNIKIIFFYFLKIIFDISVSNDIKIPKKLLIWSKEKNKKISIFFLNIFETQEIIKIHNILQIRLILSKPHPYIFKFNEWDIHSSNWRDLIYIYNGRKNLLMKAPFLSREFKFEPLLYN